MTNTRSVSQTIAASTTLPLQLRPRTATAAPISTPEAVRNKEDSVDLSNTAQQYLAVSQSDSPQAQDMVLQLVRAAAAGDTGALSLLTVV